TRSDDLAAAEGEQLPGQRRALPRCVEDVLGFDASRFGLVGQQQLRVADDDREKVVEIMGESAREAADSLHLLRVRELGLEPALLADVALDDRQRRRISFVIAKEEQRRL